jgi:hypothetical protein
MFRPFVPCGQSQSPLPGNHLTSQRFPSLSQPRCRQDPPPPPFAEALEHPNWGVPLGPQERKKRVAFSPGT